MSGNWQLWQIRPELPLETGLPPVWLEAMLPAPGVVFGAVPEQLDPPMVRCGPPVSEGLRWQVLLQLDRIQEVRKNRWSALMRSVRTYLGS